MAAAISTWGFGEIAVNNAKLNIENEKDSTSATVSAISDFEDDIETGCYIVGKGGFPNAEGILQCDAAIMQGKDLSFGAVAALEGISTPIRVAESVLRHSCHSMLVGEGAQKFALEQGHTLQENSELIGKKSMGMYNTYLKKEKSKDIGSKTHDTLGLIVIDRHGNISAGVSSSGIKWKYPGRVGDSPLPGCGLYADNSIGAACATGDGDEILKFCPSHLTVMLMSQGKSPGEACQMAVKHMCDRWTGSDIFEVGIIAMNKNGEFGAATTVSEWIDEVTNKSYNGFPYAVWTEGTDVKVHVVSPDGQVK